MKYLLQNKLNILLIFLLLVSTTGILFLVFYEEKEEPAVSVVENIEIQIESSEPKEETKELIELPLIDENTTREELEKFFEENNFTDVNFEYVISELEKDKVIKMNVSGSVTSDELIMVTLSAGSENEEIEITVPDFTAMSLSECEAWAKANSINLKITYNVSDTVIKGEVLSQSVLKGKIIKPGENITIVISDGKGIVIPDFSDKTESDVKSWIKENNIENVTFSYEYSSDYDKNKVISFKPKSGVTISSDYPCSFVISKGKQTEIKSGMEGKSIEELKKYVLSVDSTLKLSDNGNSYYSNDFEKGSIYSYTTGIVEEGSTVEYSLSLGKLSLSADEFNGLSKSEANELVSSYKEKKAEVTLQLNDTETENENEISKTYGCKISGLTVTCKFGIKKEVIPIINASDYDGLKKATAEKKMQSYSSNYGKGSISFVYEETDDSKADVTYGCSLSKNNVSCKLYRPSFDDTKLINQSEENARRIVDEYNNTYNADLSLNISRTENEEKTAGLIYECNRNLNVYSCKLATKSQKAEIMEPDAYSYAVKTTYDGTKDALEEIFAPFEKVTYKGVSSTKPVGQIVHITVNSVTDSYEGGSYPVSDTVIVIEICNENLK